MKVFIVITERDGETTKVPGKVETEMVRRVYRYAAETFEEVYEAYRRGQDPEETLTVIAEEHPAIIILTPKREEE
jgi:hypothetical protein